MDTVSISISQLKTNPAKAIAQADDYPLTVKNRGQVKAYLLGKEIFEKIISCLEDHVDRKTVKKTDFSKGRDFEKVANGLGI